MKRIRKVSIQKPCQQNWDNMTDLTGGKFCLSCQKNVVDFTRMTHDEIIGFLAGKNNLCGRFNSLQLIDVNRRLDVQNRKPDFIGKRWLMTAAFFGSTLFYKANGQTKSVALPVIEQNPSKSYPNNSLSGKVAISHPFEREIKGQILDDDYKALHGATIRVVGMELATATDTDGRFKFHRPAAAKQFTVSFVGFKPETIDIDNAWHNGYTVILTPQVVTLNDVVVVKGYAFQRCTDLLGGITVVTSEATKRHSWWWRIYHKYIVDPLHKIFH